jgi:hypothetical protein
MLALVSFSAFWVSPPFTLYYQDFPEWKLVFKVPAFVPYPIFESLRNGKVYKNIIDVGKEIGSKEYCVKNFPQIFNYFTRKKPDCSKFFYYIAMNFEKIPSSYVLVKEYGTGFSLFKVS